MQTKTKQNKKTNLKVFKQFKLFKVQSPVDFEGNLNANKTKQNKTKSKSI